MCFLIRKFMFMDCQCGAAWVTLTFNKKHKGDKQKESPHQKQGCYGEAQVPWGKEGKLMAHLSLSCYEPPEKVAFFPSQVS